MAEPPEWESFEWLSETRQLLKWVNQVNVRTPMMLVVRHSHREESNNVQELRMKELTPLGHRMAMRFGEKLPFGRDIKLFYSSHVRCVQTARDIAEGYRSIGGSTELVSDIRVLLGPFGSGQKIAEQIMEGGGAAFVIKWSEGQLSADTIEPIELFRDRFIAEIVGRFALAKTHELQVHVTHDLVIMGARLVLLKTQPTGSNWSRFLGGFGAAFDGGGVCVFEDGQARAEPELASLLSGH